MLMLRLVLIAWHKEKLHNFWRDCMSSEDWLLSRLLLGFAAFGYWPSNLIPCIHMYSHWLQHSFPSSLSYCNHVYYVFSPNLILLQIPPLLSLTINAYSPTKKLKVINLVQHFSSHQWKGKNIRNTASTHSATLFTMKKDWVLHISNGTNIGFFGEIKSEVRDGYFWIAGYQYYLLYLSCHSSAPCSSTCASSVE